ncbi:hypothetical protein D9M72_595590 [compost metagenome]
MRAIGMQHALMSQLLNGGVALVVGIDLNQRLRPVTAAGIFLLHGAKDVIGGDAAEAAREAAVFRDQLISESEDVVHHLPLCSSWWLLRGASGDDVN